MIFPDIFRLIFIIISAIFIGLLVFLTILMYKKKNEYRLYITLPIITGILSIIAYCLFLLCKDHDLAVLFDSMFFIGTDWLAFFMLLFAIHYTEYAMNLRRVMLGMFIAFAGIDTVGLFVNNYTHHMFDLVLMEKSILGQYWGNDFYLLHYLHLLLCYAMVFLTFLFFILSVVKSPKFYRKKYHGIFCAYLIVILANCVCYSLNLPYDISVILYAFLAGFICYYSTYTFPHSLVNQSLKNVNDTISDGVLYFDSLGECIYANKVAKEIFSEFGFYKKVIAEDFRKKLITEGVYGASDKIETLICGNQPRRYRVEFNQEIVKGQEIGSYLKLIDYTVAINAIERERYTAIHDELTGLYNRTGYFEAVDTYIKNNGSVGKVMLTSNIKDFKLINDLFGEKAGDELLLRQGQITVEALHKNSLCGRISDDKFSIFIDKEYAIESRFEKYISNLQKITEASMFQMHVYVGIYDPKGRIEPAQVMYDKTLLALEQIKGNYAKYFSYYDSPLMEKLLNEKNIIEDFVTAIDKNQIKMYLQPIVTDDSNKKGAEALVRWQHPLRGFMKPEAFLGILEKQGLIYQLDEYMWTQAAKKLKEWNEAGCTDCYISVNVSVKDFFYTDIYKTFTRLVEDYDISPESLHIELTESVLMSDFTKAFILSNKLQKEGFCVTIDNFGNGYSSMNMLKDFKAQIIKMDMSFIQNSSEQERGQIILESIINLTKSLGMEIIGSGIENREQLNTLKKFGCNNFQGNFISEPLTISEYEEKYIKGLQG